MLKPEEAYELSGSSVIRIGRNHVLIRMDDGSEVWIPLSEVVDVDELDEDTTDISVRAEWAEREGVL